MSIKIVFKYPEQKKELKELKKRCSYVKAMLILKGIKELNMEDKEKLLHNVIEELEKRGSS